MAIRGDEPIKIMRRAGHENMETTMGYVREAENLVTPIGNVFPVLPSQLLETSEESSEGPRAWSYLRGNIKKNVASPAGFENPPKTSNGHVTAVIDRVNTPSSAQTNAAKCLIPGVRGDSLANPMSRLDQTTRQELIAALTTAIAKATASGDLGLARVAMDALNKLVIGQNSSN